MKYVLMVHSSDDHDVTLTPEETEQLRAESMPRWIALFEHMGKVDPSIEGTELDSHELAKTVRVRDGKVQVTDGPFVETREQLGGYYLIEANDLDDATKIAARIPAARHGSIEVRPVMVFNR